MDQFSGSRLKNHAPDLIALDFFTVATATFRVLFVLVVLTHGRRRLLHFNVTEHPTAEWTARQLLEACALEEGPRYLIRDRDKSMATAINVSASHCSSRRTSTGSLEDAVRRSRRRGPGIHVESSRSPARHTRFATASGGNDGLLDVHHPGLMRKSFSLDLVSVRNQ